MQGKWLEHVKDGVVETTVDGDIPRKGDWGCMSSVHADGTSWSVLPQKGVWIVGAGEVKSIQLPSNKDEADRQGQDH